MLIVGPRRTCAPFACASSERSRPRRVTKSVSKVAPMAVPQGRQADGVLSKKCVPRTPLGPSESRMGFMPRRSMVAVCHHPLPEPRLEVDIGIEGD